MPAQKSPISGTVELLTRVSDRIVQLEARGKFRPTVHDMARFKDAHERLCLAAADMDAFLCATAFRNGLAISDLEAEKS
jgi:hypothetical protein